MSLRHLLLGGVFRQSLACPVTTASQYAFTHLCRTESPQPAPDPPPQWPDSGIIQTLPGTGDGIGSHYLFDQDLEVCNQLLLI